ncbi:hypothetical protein PIB30_090920 [Stylosanthes scabra]|uniref:Uncharacterized protein n=1 Tax=Stylosanthes scabra TaxID=79078 RepID=A0ABU6RUC4_9FABA|nr:hypothetical protein [Stylosanthes scabra]
MVNASSIYRHKSGHWCVRIGLSAFLCDLLIPRALFSHFRSELCLLKPEILERTHQGIVRNRKREGARRPKDPERGSCNAHGGHGVDVDEGVYLLRSWSGDVQEITQGENGIVFGFSVILANNQRGLELVAHGTRSTDETAARQYAAFVMLEKLLSATGYTICDYTHRIIRRVQEPNRNLLVEQLANLEDHLRQLQIENTDLKEQIYFFQEILDE